MIPLVKIIKQKETVNLKSKWVSAVSPQRTLERGYTLTRSAKGKTQADWGVGEELVTETNSQVVHSKVVEVIKKKN